MTPNKSKGATVTMMLYTGNADFIQGIPTRDLTMDEWAAIEKAVDPLILEAAQSLYTQGEVSVTLPDTQVDVPVPPVIDANPLTTDNAATPPSGE